MQESPSTPPTYLTIGTHYQTLFRSLAHFKSNLHEINFTRHQYLYTNFHLLSHKLIYQNYTHLGPYFSGLANPVPVSFKFNLFFKNSLILLLIALNKIALFCIFMFR